MSTGDMKMQLRRLFCMFVVLKSNERVSSVILSCQNQNRDSYEALFNAPTCSSSIIFLFLVDLRKRNHSPITNEASHALSPFRDFASRLFFARTRRHCPACMQFCSIALNQTAALSSALTQCLLKDLPFPFSSRSERKWSSF